MTSADIITLIYNNVNRTDITRPQILSYMNNRKNQICNYDNYSFMEGTSTAPTVAGQQSYDIPSDYKDELQVWLTDSTNVTKYYLDKWVGTQAENSFSNATTQAKPYAYWVWNDAYFFYPIPDQVYTVDLKYYRFIPDFTDVATEENELGKYWVDLIANGATSDCFHFVMQPDKTTEWQAKWTDEFQKLIRRQAKKKTTNYTPRVRLRIK